LEIDLSGSSLPQEESRALSQVRRCLDLETLDDDLFLGDPGPGEGRLFGGMVAAQSVVAAFRTVEDARRIHSLHAYFLRPGRHQSPIRFLVDRIRDGRTFTTRRVVAHQAGEAIFSLEASFAVAEEGIEHQDPKPEAPPPEQCDDSELRRLAKLGEEWIHHPVNAVELRFTEPWDVGGKGESAGGKGEESGQLGAIHPQQRYWMRARGHVGADARLHAALFVYASDRALLGTAARPHGVRWGRSLTASLDHTMWFHRDVDIDDWLLFDARSPAAHGGLALVVANVYRGDGALVATVAQEALIRPRP
jgi:acyl-CoA thioesterase-2